MPITSRSEYGMRAMILLAEQRGEDLLSASELSRREHIPLKYLEQLLSELKKAGLVMSFPGARGGYRLARTSVEITVGEVVRALDGAFAPMSCVVDGEREPCAFEEGCKLRPLWSRVHVALHNVLDKTSLHELAAATPTDLRRAAALPLGQAAVHEEPAGGHAEVSPEDPLEDPLEEPAEEPTSEPPRTHCGLMYIL